MKGETYSSGVASIYMESLRHKNIMFIVMAALLCVLAVWALGAGACRLDLSTVLRAIFAGEGGRSHIVVWHLRMPRIAAAIITGAGLGLSGVITQSLLKNHLASPFTLGISQGAAFGAAFAIVVLGAGGASVDGTLPSGVGSLYAVPLSAFGGAMCSTTVILLLARVKKMAPESVILAGVALSSLFMSGTILIQYLASEVEVATVVFWTFGDVSRSGWGEIGLLSVVTLVVLVCLLLNRWNLNALAAGDEQARALGVEVDRLRFIGMLLAALVAALATAFHGVIAFLGLLAPHIGRRLAGDDHRLLIPYSCLIGALLLLGADTLGRQLLGSSAMPVGVLTSFMGAPLFLFLLIKGVAR